MGTILWPRLRQYICLMSDQGPGENPQLSVELCLTLFTTTISECKALALNNSTHWSSLYLVCNLSLYFKWGESKFFFRIDRNISGNLANLIYSGVSVETVYVLTAKSMSVYFQTPGGFWACRSRKTPKTSVHFYGNHFKWCTVHALMQALGDTLDSLETYPLIKVMTCQQHFRNGFLVIMFPIRIRSNKVLW